MTKFYTFVCALAFAFLTSCQFSENIYINEDGTGKMEFSFDGTELMKMAGDGMGEANEKAMDSTFSFKELFEGKQDSIAQLPAEERAILEELKNFTMRMVMNPETKEMKMDMITEFKNVGELQDMFSKMNKLQALNKEEQAANNPMSSMNQGGFTDLKYEYNGKVFKRNVTITDKALHQKMIDSLGDMTEMYASSTYKLNYHFPKPVKSVSNENALFSADRKMVTISYNFTDYLLDPEALNLEVVLED
jgi:hypothetical protein